MALPLSSTTLGGTRDGVDTRLKLDSVVPWGRSFDEYCRMFALRSVDLAGRILGCADGPAAFNAELTARGGRIVSVDPLYQFSAAEIRSRIGDARERVIANTMRNLDAYKWERIPSIEALSELRRGAMTRFLEDYESGREAGRYLPVGLPTLPFREGAFDLVLCSHFLFLYSPTIPLDLHLAAMREMLRVGREVRVFPLLDFDGNPSPHLTPVIDDLRGAGFLVEQTPVPYEFQRGADRMLVVRRR